MTSFEEQFPSLKDLAEGYVFTNLPDGKRKQVKDFSEIIIQQHCLDKQKVRDIIQIKKAIAKNAENSIDKQMKDIGNIRLFLLNEFEIELGL